MSFEKMIAGELTKSYLQAGRHISSENVAIVAKSLDSAIDFDTEEEVLATFKRARDMEDIPTQRVIKEALRNHRAENIPQPNTQLIAEGTTEETRPVTYEEKQYIFAWWHLHGTRMSWLTDEKAQEIITKFESDPNHKEFTTHQNAKCTPVAYRNIKVYGETTMRGRLVP